MPSPSSPRRAAPPAGLPHRQETARNRPAGAFPDLPGQESSLPGDASPRQPAGNPRPPAARCPAWPSFALVGSYELLMRQVRRTRPEVSDRLQGQLRDRPSRNRRRMRRPFAGSGAGARLAGMCASRRGSGRWRTGPLTARCPAARRSHPGSAGTSGGVGSEFGRATPCFRACLSAPPRLVRFKSPEQIQRLGSGLVIL
jgi:hypothetical protein